VLGVSRGGGSKIRGAWWWNEEVKVKVKKKRNAYAMLSNSTSNETKEVREARYLVAKKLAKKAVTIAKNNAYERLYQRLEIDFVVVLVKKR